MKRKHSRTNLRFEALERRQMLDGNITATVVNNVLTLRGDTAYNGVAVTESSNGVIEVIGLNQGVNSGNQSPLPTTINGQSRKFFTGITSININLNDGHVGTNEGNDAVVLTNLTLSGSVNINTSDGSDFVGVGQFDNSGNLVDSAVNSLLGPVKILSGLAINGQGGDDKIIVQNADLRGPAGPNLSITGTDGSDTLTLQNVAVVHALNITNTGQLALNMDTISTNMLNISTGVGNDQISLTNSTVKSNANIATSFGNNSVTFNTVNLGWLSTALGPGDNTLSATGVTVAHFTSISAGAGNDSVTFNNFTGRGIDIALGQGETSGVAAGNDTITFNTVTAASLSLKGGIGLGIDDFSLTGVTVANALTINTGPGADTVGLTNVSVGTATTIDTGAGNDTVTLDGLQSRRLSVTLDDGADSISLHDVTIAKNDFIGGGNGFDTYTDLGGNSLGTLTRRNFEKIQ
jgi:hypothetical protein